MVQCRSESDPIMISIEVGQGRSTSIFVLTVSGHILCTKPTQNTKKYPLRGRAPWGRCPKPLLLVHRPPVCWDAPQTRNRGLAAILEEFGALRHHQDSLSRDRFLLCSKSLPSPAHTQALVCLVLSPAVAALFCTLGLCCTCVEMLL